MIVGVPESLLEDFGRVGRASAFTLEGTIGEPECDPGEDCAMDAAGVDSGRDPIGADAGVHVDASSMTDAPIAAPDADVAIDEGPREVGDEVDAGSDAATATGEAPADCSCRAVRPNTRSLAPGWLLPGVLVLAWRARVRRTKSRAHA